MNKGSCPHNKKMEMIYIAGTEIDNLKKKEMIENFSSVCNYLIMDTP